MGLGRMVLSQIQFKIILKLTPKPTNIVCFEITIATFLIVKFRDPSSIGSKATVHSYIGHGVFLLQDFIWCLTRSMGDQYDVL